MRRREFVGTVLLGGAVGRAGVPQGPADGGGEERMTWPTGDGYEAPVATAENEVRWVQVDLGSVTEDRRGEALSEVQPLTAARDRLPS
jgi:hypothetical protein